MDYQLCKKLKDAGFPQEDNGNIFYCNRDLPDSNNKGSKSCIKVPTLSELIQECGATRIAPNLNTKEQKLAEHYFRLGIGDEWYAEYKFYESVVINKATALPIIGWGITPEIAVANLYLELNK